MAKGSRKQVKKQAQKVITIIKARGEPDQVEVKREPRQAPQPTDTPQTTQLPPMKPLYPRNIRITPKRPHVD
ncbi:hypothetical protein ACFLV8_02260 [Chloroflexota bacterium]